MSDFDKHLTEEPESAIVPAASDMADKRPVIASRNAITVRSTRSMTITPVGLKIVGVIQEDEWEATADSVIASGQALAWVMGDLFLNVNHEWGAYKRFAEKYSIDWRALQDYCYVCRNVDLSVRTDKLSFTHHRQVAPYFNPNSPDETRELQRRILERAVEKQMTVAQLKTALNPDTGSDGLPAPIMDKQQKNRFNTMWRNGMQGKLVAIDMQDVSLFDKWWQDFKQQVKAAKNKRGE